MTSLYEVLKARRNLIVEDIMAVLWGKKTGGKQKGYKVTISGATPLYCPYSLGYNLLEYYIEGNGPYQSAAPTPESPVEVQGVGDKYKKNLFEPEIFRNTSINGESYWSSGGNGIVLRIPCRGGTKYILSIDTTAITSTIYRISCTKETATPSQWASIKTTDIHKGSSLLDSVGFTTSTDAIYILVQVSANVTNAAINLFELTYNNLYITTVINRGRNLYNPDAITKGYYINAQGVETKIGVPGYGALNHTEKIMITPLTPYTLKVYEYTSANTCAFCWYKDNILLSRNTFDISANLGGYQRTYTSPENANYLIINFFTTNYEKIIIERGTEASEYEPYREPTTATIYTDAPLFSGDYVSKDSTGGKEHREWGEYICTGNETISLQSINSYGIANFLFLNSISGMKYWTTIVSSHFAQQDTLIVDTKTEGLLASNSGAFYLRVFNTRASTINDFKTWLKSEYDKGTPVTIYYHRTTPTDTPKDLPEIPTITGEMWIDTHTQIPPAAMSVKYLAHRPLDFSLNNSRLDDESYVQISSMELDSSEFEDYKYVLK